MMDKWLKIKPKAVTGEGPQQSVAEKKKDGRGGARLNAGRKKKIVEEPRFKLPEYRGGKRAGAGRKSSADSTDNDRQASKKIKAAVADDIVDNDDQNQPNIFINVPIVTSEAASADSRLQATPAVETADAVDQSPLLQPNLAPVLGTLSVGTTSDESAQIDPVSDQGRDIDDLLVGSDHNFEELNCGSRTDVQSNQVVDDLSEDFEDDLPQPKAGSVVAEYLASVFTKVKDRNSNVMKAVRGGNFWIEPPNPLVALTKSINNGLQVNPNDFYYPRVFVFVPDAMFPHLKIPCPNPSCSSASVVPKGFPEYMRRIVDVEDCYYIATCRYQCKDCNTHFVPTSADVLRQFPLEVQFAFPCLLSKRSGIDLKIVKMLNIFIDQSMGPQAVADYLKELHSLKHQELEVQYYSTLNTLKAVYASQTRLFASKIDSSAVQFSKFADPNGYSGFTPSGNYLLSVFLKDYQRKKSYYDLEVQRRGGKVLSVDHSFKWTRHLMQVNGQQLFEGLHSVMNEYEEIRQQSLVQSVSNDYLRDQMENMQETYNSLGHELPELVYTDNCCNDRAFYESVFPSLRQSTKLISEFPNPKQIIYLNDYSSACASAFELFNRCVSSKDQVKIGLDCEWTTNNVGKAGKVDLLQLAFQDGDVYLFHLTHFKQFPPSLKLLLESQQCLFIGRSIGGDVKYLLQDFNIRVSQTLELSKWAKDVGLVNKATLSLDALVQIVLGYQLPKSANGPRLSNWAKSKLTQEQQIYAAKDAMASLLVYLQHIDRDFDISSCINSDDCCSPTSDGSELSASLTTRVLLDPYHAMARIPVKKGHAFMPQFCRKFRDALFIIHPQDRAALEQYVKESDEYESFDDLMAAKPNWVLERCRREIPSPVELRKRLEALIAEYQKDCYCDPSDGARLLDQDCLDAFKKLLVHIDKGCLSDPVGIGLYYETGQDSKGLTTYRCIRGTSDLEGGIHQKLVRKFKTWNAGPAFADAALSVIRHRFNVRASERNRLGFPKLGHYDHFLMDFVQKFSKAIYGSSVHKWWSDLTDLTLSSEQFGVIPCIPRDQYESVSEEQIRHYKPSIQYLAKKTKSVVPYLPMLNSQEHQQFGSLLNLHLRQVGSVKRISFQKMADEWNTGYRCATPDGLTIFKKIPRHLELYLSRYLDIVTRSSAHRLASTSTAQLSALLERDIGAKSLHLLKPAEADSISHNAAYVDDGDNDSLNQTLAEQSLVANVTCQQSSLVDQQLVAQPVSVISGSQSQSRNAEAGSRRMQLVATSVSVSEKSSNQSVQVVPKEIQFAQPKSLSLNNNKQCKSCGLRRYDNPGCPGGTARGTCIEKIKRGEGKKTIQSKGRTQSSSS
ncbi:hypothetical protein MP228_005630 [Amoeboaphelidium protococcarum]|nr:hypothetical protein MP228_005630 [Amoeboaphelidium protococcarum]